MKGPSDPPTGDTPVSNGFRHNVPLLLARQRRESSRARAARRLVSLIWLSLLVVVVLFVAAGGLTKTGSSSAVLGTAANLAALLGTDLILVMIVLAARVPVIDRVVGHDQALVLHRRLAGPAFLLIVIHIGLVCAALTTRGTHSFLWHSLVVMSYSALVLAFLATALMVVVVVSSWVVVRRRLPFELWHALHFLTYAFVIMAIPHELGRANVFRPGTPEADYWVGLHVVALGAVLLYRFVVPLIRSAQHRLRIARIEFISSDAFTVTLTGAHLERLDAAAGQYAVWRFWHASTWWHAHPIGFSSPPTADALTITIRVAGSGTERISRLRSGTRVSFEGPYGRLTEDSRTASRLIAVAAGIGITPLKALIEQSELAPGEASVLLRGTSADALYLWPELLELARTREIVVQPMVGGHVRGQATWMSAEAHTQGVTLSSLFPQLLEADLYVCGPPAWADLVARDALAAGLPTQQLHLPG